MRSLAQGFSSLSDLAEHLVSAVDIVFPVIHGRFGEDGGIQVLCTSLFSAGIAYVTANLINTIAGAVGESQHSICWDWIQ